MFDEKFPFNISSICDSLNIDVIGNRVRNRVIFANDDFMVMVVVGPNKRSDYHVNSKQVSSILCLKNLVFRNSSIKLEAHLSLKYCKTWKLKQCI